MTPRLFAVALLALTVPSCKTTPRACEKMKALCGTELDSCTSARDSVKEKFGPEALDKFDACYLESSSCAEANGCLTGAAFKATADAAKSFLNGLEKELDKKK